MPDQQNSRSPDTADIVSRSLAAIGFGAVGDAFGLSTAMLVAAFATFGGLPLIWVLFRRSAAAGDTPS